MNSPYLVHLRGVQEELNLSFLCSCQIKSIGDSIGKVAGREREKVLAALHWESLFQGIVFTFDNQNYYAYLKEIDNLRITVVWHGKDILSIALNDSFTFSLIDCEELDVLNKKYPGYRINIQVNLGKTKDRLQVDLGVGDVVDEFEMEFDVLQYKGAPLISQGGVSILAYPPEFIFSEKLQAIIDLGTLNSRMKDYFDCHVLITKGVLDKERAVSAIQKTFQNRKTEIQKIEPAQEDMVGLWLSFQRKVPVAPKDISEVINVINEYLVNVGLV